MNAATAGPDVNFLNVEYFFRIIANLLQHTPDLLVLAGPLMLLISHAWILLCVVSFGVCALAVFILVQSTTRLKEVYAAQDEAFATIGAHEAEENVEHTRWAYIKNLIESTADTDWRQAIIEADIMLEDMLTKNGFQGDSVSDKLKSADPQKFHTLQEAWAGHNVRNRIAHDGSAYELTSQLAYRTISHFENVFREFHFI